MSGEQVVEQPEQHPRPAAPIEAIAVIGAGTMGLGIAHVAAVAGYDTRLYDVDAGALERAAATIHRNLEKGVALGKIDESAAAGARELLSTGTDLAAAVGSAGLVIEAVPESMEIKIETFRQVASAAAEGALFASNTSGLSITEMAAASDRPERFIGMHFFNPVHVMKLIEVVRGLETSDEAIDAVAAVGKRMGKRCVVVNESPGFVTSRINALIGNEAFRMLEHGIASAEDIDTALRLGLNHPMGPFEMVDLVGLDIRLGVLRHLHATLGDLYRPSPLLVQYVQAGRLGRKSGRGVYRYDRNGRRIGE